MTIKKFTSGSLLTAAQQNDLQQRALRAIGQNVITTLIDRTGVWDSATGSFWGDAYVDSNGRENSVDTDNTSAIFDTNKYKIPDIAIVIEATSISSVADFNINDCEIINVDTGKWVLTCDTGTDEVKRAQLYKTLFFGTDGSDARASSTYITGITKLGTTITRDVGKQAHCVSISSMTATSVAVDENYEGTFVNTSTNTDCSFWSNTYSNSAFTDVDTYFPTGTPIIQNPGAATTNQIGTDTSTDETDNPTSCKIRIDDDTGPGSSDYGVAKCIILCKGDITWVESGSQFTYNNIDFLTDNSIPVFTDGKEDIVSLIYHNIPYEAESEATADYTDATEYTTTSETYDTLISRTSLNKRIYKIEFDVKEAVQNAAYRITFTYTDSSTEVLTNTATTTTSYQTITYTNPYPVKKVSSITIEMELLATGGTAYLKDYSEFLIKNLKGQFNSSIASSFSTVIFDDWEDGVSVQYKLTNTDGDDTDWLSINEVSTFTTFTAEPDTMIVKLVPASGGTTGYPSIRGVVVEAD